VRWVPHRNRVPSEVWYLNQNSKLFLRVLEACPELVEGSSAVRGATPSPTLPREVLHCHAVANLHPSRAAGCILLLIAACAQAQSPAPGPATTTNDPARLVGAWEGRDRSEEGLGETVVLQPGGALTITSGMMLNFQGRVVKGELVALVESLSNVPQEVHIRANGDRMTYTVAGAPQQWVRIGKAVPDQPAWAGAWAFESAAPPRKSHRKYDGERMEIEQLMRTNMRMAITPDGKGRLRFPMNTQTGAYLVQGNKLVLQYSGQVSFVGWRLEGNTLFLQYPNRQAESAFDRVQLSAP